MPHSRKQAEQWLQLVMAQELPSRDVLASHIAAGQITELCTCGCHGFTFVVPDGIKLQPLSRSHGLFCELVFQSTSAEEVDILLFTDARGYFSGADVTYGACNTGPMPDGIVATKLSGIWPQPVET